MNSSREIAAEILLKNELDKAYSAITLNEILKKHKIENSRDKSLITNIVYGVCERKITLDYNISLYLKSPIKKLHPAVLVSLRLGAYQIFFSDRIPDRAAINESVELTKKTKTSFASGMVNAVLRKISVEGIKYPEKNDKIKYLSVFYSCPEYLINHFIRYYGEKSAVSILQSSIGRRPLYIKVNSLKTTEEQLYNSLTETGVDVKRTALQNCLQIDNTGDISSLPQFINGEFFVQDMSSQLSVMLLDAKPGEKIVDCCAAPGGKSFSVAINSDDKASVFSCDIYPHKTDLIEAGALRLGLTSVRTICMDARKLKHNFKDVDKVLCDVPCSGFGVIGRKPEIKYKKSDEINELPELQLDILENCSVMVKKGGILVYSTCTLNPLENENVCDEFLKRHPDFTVRRDGLYAEKCLNGRYLTVLPSENGGDGFFTAEFIRSIE